MQPRLLVEHPADWVPREDFPNIASKKYIVTVTSYARNSDVNSSAARHCPNSKTRDNVQPSNLASASRSPSPDSIPAYGEPENMPPSLLCCIPFLALYISKPSSAPPPSMKDANTVNNGIPVALGATAASPSSTGSERVESHGSRIIIPLPVHSTKRQAVDFARGVANEPRHPHQVN
ncbi:hypothetical protein BDV98DRAFT_596840 [Pterulicium gracile]|uniref:Uncharacterized protein n=1 Tax=Pterulicium gracile TaxID=1884261 RepID=A0A5C3QAK6_9AGAR|nr:hypothetical protein BDV98DRAFT_596840 [Pterula gracilis]